MITQSLFEEDVQCEAPRGLVYQENFLSLAEEAEIVAWIDAQVWDHGYARRRQFYGQSYREPSHYTPVPECFKVLARRLFEQGLTTVIADHVLINEYLPGQGIAAHVDEMPHPDSQVVTISMLDNYPMEFVHIADGHKFETWLARRSVAVMSGAAKTDWTHEIVKRKADVVPGGGRRVRGRRISITYRTNL
jgi:alkylated DNA repair dioxygenase AlkB